MLRGFENQLLDYLEVDKGKILDIGCGQSPHLLSMVGTRFDLYAVDEDLNQLRYLRQRVKDEAGDENRLYYFSEKFPSDTFTGLKFNGIIASNILHFYSFTGAASFVERLENYLADDGLILIKVHNKDHGANKAGSRTHFKHFFSREDLVNLFPPSRYELLFFSHKNYVKTTSYKNFLREWIRGEWLLEGVNDEEIIRQAQDDYLKGNDENSLTFLTRKRSTIS